jgi:H+-transporting ATPase
MNSTSYEGNLSKAALLGKDAAGLTSEEAQNLIAKVGLNSMPNTTSGFLGRLSDKFWAPIPWMLEAAIILQLFTHKFAEATIIFGLLVFNAALGFFQEGKAQATLAALKSKLALNASVKRDGLWRIIPAAELVPGDLVKLSLGAVVPADVTIVEGSVLLDQSMLTGESEPVETGAGGQTYAGALVRRGAADALVTQTGARTKFGHTAELVRTAHVVSSQQKAVLHVVQNLVCINAVVIVGIAVYAMILGMDWREIVPLVLTAVMGAIPVALPATFTLAAAIGARSLARVGILSTRLSAIDEAASMDILCSDKTGTLTRNQLAVASVQPMTGFNEAYVLELAALASEEGGEDPVDAAIQASNALNAKRGTFKLVTFTPFDPTKKTSEATAAGKDGKKVRIVKGAYNTIAALVSRPSAAAAAVDELEKQGFRVLAVAVGPASKTMKIVGLIALSDPPRSDSAALVAELKALGVRTVMVTGDAPATAATIAHAVGIDGPICRADPMLKDITPEQFAVFAGYFPAGKYDLVKAFQRDGHIVGMCGDGVNDAPALRQAQMGIAVSTATDVAKSAAGLMLTTAGLAGIVAAIKEGRSAFQRILTYTLDAVTKKIVLVFFLAIGLIVTGQAILTPMLIAIVLITGDFLKMSITTDDERPSQRPNTWQIGKLTLACSVLSFCFLAFCVGALLVGKYWLGFDIDTLRTLSVIAIVFCSEATLYVVRERKHAWSSIPGKWVLVASVADIIIMSSLAIFGIAMQPLPITVVAFTLGAALLFILPLDLIKTLVFRWLQIV